MDEIELLDLYNSSSIIRDIFNRKINLKGLSIQASEIPKQFKDISLIPKKGLNLAYLSKKLEKELEKSKFYKKEEANLIPGICEAIKNAYEHGNNQDNLKKINIARKFSKKSVEFFVGDKGGIIDGNFFPYILLFRDKNYAKSLDDIPDFYSFCGKNYAPLGHSGVGTKVMNKCFDEVKYFKGAEGLLVSLKKFI